MKTKLTKKTIGLVVLTVALFAGIFAVGSAWAYFSDNANEENRITLRAVDTEIEETIDSTTMTKEPSVKNTGTHECIVRLKVVVTPESELTNIKYRNLNTDEWKYNEADGYYYYQGLLAEGKSTPAIFTGIDFVDKEAMNDFDILLYQEAVQPEIIDENGNKIKAVDADGKYDQSNADVIWKLFEAQ